MLKIKDLLFNPFYLFILMMLTYSLFRVLMGNHLDEVIRSDGRGYYAYLPALLIYNDGSFTSSMSKEKEYFPECTDQLYIYKDAQNKNFNKYFPGVAILQLPFFGMACGVSALLNLPVDGYSWVFSLFYYLGYLFYAISGMICSHLLLIQLFPEQKKSIRFFFPLLYFSSTLLFYSFNTPSFSHAYSIFLFAAFGLLVLQLKKSNSLKSYVLIGFVFGLIFLVRPTNILILFIVPFLLGNRSAFRQFAVNLFHHNAKRLLVAICACLLTCSFLFLVWKWQTGNWILWSYNGEGFDFLQPHIFDSLFSFRNGMFLHNPVILFSVVAVIFLWKSDRFLALVWSLYFALNLWIISSWWCWDYESPFGNRPFSEHTIFLLLPLLKLLETSLKKLTTSLLLITSVIGIVRYFEISSGYMPDQRFTSENFLASLKFWDKRNENRWYFSKGCPPYGTSVKTYIISNEPQERIVGGDEFLLSGKIVLPKKRNNERYYYRVSVQKKHNQITFEGVHLVLDAVSKDKTHRFYRCIPFYNDLRDGGGKWVTVEMSGQVYDNLYQYDTISIYIWNQSRKNFILKDAHIELDVYRK